MTNNLLSCLRTFKFNSQKTFKKEEQLTTFLIASRKKKKMKTMNKTVVISSVIESQCYSCRRNQMKRKKMRRRLMRKLKKRNPCILRDLAKTLINLEIPKSKEEVTIHRQSILSIAEKISATKVQMSWGPITWTSIRTTEEWEGMKDFKNSVTTVDKL